jgi:hypothetical protein
VWGLGCGHLYPSPLGVVGPGVWGPLNLHFALCNLQFSIRPPAKVRAARPRSKAPAWERTSTRLLPRRDLQSLRATFHVFSAQLPPRNSPQLFTTSRLPPTTSLPHQVAHLRVRAPLLSHPSHLSSSDTPPSASSPLPLGEARVRASPSPLPVAGEGPGVRGPACLRPTAHCRSPTADRPLPSAPFMHPAKNSSAATNHHNSFPSNQLRQFPSVCVYASYSPHA